jgi:hypothetical protein
MDEERLREEKPDMNGKRHVQEIEHIKATKEES